MCYLSVLSNKSLQFHKPMNKFNINLRMYFVELEKSIAIYKKLCLKRIIQINVDADSRSFVTWYLTPVNNSPESS